MNAVRLRAIEELKRLVFDALGDHDAAAYLFGSCARDEVRYPDDIDIAIFPRPSAFPACLFIKLENDFEDSTIPYDVDLVDLRKVDRTLLDEVFWTGIQWRE